VIFLSPEQVNCTTRRAPRYFIVALGLSLASLLAAKPLQFPVVPWITCVALFYLSFVSVMLRQWRVEYGLWMMAGLLLLPVSTMYYLLVSWEIRHFLAARQAQPNLRAVIVAFQWLLQAADVSIAGHVYWRQVQLCITVIRLNWPIRRGDWQAYRAAHRIGFEYQPAHVIEKYRRRRRVLLSTSLAAMGVLLVYFAANAQANRSSLVIFGGILLGISVFSSLWPEAIAPQSRRDDSI
jgi:hypothetical protein